MNHEIDKSYEIENIEEGSSTSDQEKYTKPPTISNEDEMALTPKEASTIRALLALAPPPSGRETRKLLNSIDSTPITLTFNKIISLSKTTNKELVHYLSVINKYPLRSLDLIKLTDFKFISQDKYLNQVIFMYFSIVDQVYEHLTYDQKKGIFYRYIYLFTNGITNDFAIYGMFKRFLAEDFLKIFVYNNFFQNFYFLKDFLFDFATLLKDDIIKIGYDIPSLREYVFSLSSSVYTNWIIQRWDIPYNYTISEFFYSFDSIYFLEDIGLRKFNTLVNPLDALLNELESYNLFLNSSSGNCPSKPMVSIFIDENTCFSIPCCDLRLKLADSKIKKCHLLESIDAFNKTGKILEPLSIANIRLFPSIKLKNLGDFLGKEANYNLLVEFCKTFDFADVDIFEAMKFFLKSFILPTESQMIERVIKGFSIAYVLQNIPNKMENPLFESTVSEYSKVAYGFIALNTMLHNPNVDKKPSFEDYLDFIEFPIQSDFVVFNSSPLDRESFKNYYNHVKENEMKAVIYWGDEFDKHTLSKALSSQFYSGIKNNISDPLNYTFDSDRINNKYCDICIKHAYKTLFQNSIGSFLHINPASFFKFCEILDFRDGVELYIYSSKKDLAKTLEAYKMFFESFIGTRALAENFIESLEKTEKNRSTVFTDLKSIFSKSSLDSREKVPYSSLIESISSLKFKSSRICTENCKLLSKALSITKKPYSKNIISSIILANTEMIENFVEMEESTVLSIFLQSPRENLASVKFPDSIKILYFKKIFSEENFSMDDYKMFSSLEIYNQHSFDAFCSAQQFIDDFDRVVKICKISSNPNLHPIFEMKELYYECMNDPNNIYKFFTSSNSIINLKIIKNIHKDSCPLKIPAFSDFNKIIYLILKTDPANQQLFNYLSYIVNYLSDSLILLVDLYSFMYPLFYQVDRSIVAILMKILSKRIKTYCINDVLCCEDAKNANNEAIPKIKFLIKRLIRDGFLNPVEIKVFIDKGIARSESIEI